MDKNRDRFMLNVLLVILLVVVGIPCHAEPPAGTGQMQQRPFYLIGHNPNEASEALAYLDGRANALEPDIYQTESGDLRVHDRVKLFGILILWPLFNGEGPLLKDYLHDLKQGLDARKGANLAMILWDLKPPFNVQWIREARALIQAELGSHYPNISMVYTVGSADGIPALQEFAKEISLSEAIGVDESVPPSVVEHAFKDTGRAYTYADGTNEVNVTSALQMRDAGNAFALVYVWTVKDRARIRQFLGKGVDGMIIDRENIPLLLDELSQSGGLEQHPLATPAHSPFGAKR
ncbi:MAG: hypothetical protein PHH47_10950 [Gallionella sp.]|nr:hypothetical protein [Gallionella sp.]MDD4946535.1 hypothetical protein [Gallionella sp.]MDD5612868.1 hypothetical protein [Gallionella sp.]